MKSAPGLTRAAGWSVVQMWGGRAIVLIAFLWIARIVAPGPVGIYVFAQAVVAALRLLTLRGFATAVVRHPTLEPIHLDVVLWTQLSLAVPIAGTTMLAAGPVAGWAGRPEVAGPVTALAPLLVVWALTSVQSARLMRTLSFRTLAVRTLGGQLVGGGCGVVLAYRGLGVWSLVVMALAAEAAGALLLWSAAGWVPRLRYSRARLRELAPFATRASAIEGLNYVVENGDDLLVGAVLGPVALGFYAAAYRIVRLLRAFVVEPVDHFILPAFARIQARRERLGARFADATGGLAMVAFPLFAALAATAGDVIPFVLGPGWERAVPVARILAAAAALRIAVSPARGALLATGRADACLRLDLAVAALSAAGFLIGIRWGVAGVAAGHVAARLAALPLSIVVAARALGADTRKMWPAFAFSVAGTAGVLAAGRASADAAHALLRMGAPVAALALYGAIAMWVVFVSRRSMAARSSASGESLPPE